MTKVEKILAKESRSGGRRGIAVRKRRRSSHYYAFLSYSHSDEALANWIFRQLEHFRVPASLAGTITDNGVVPKRLTPIFRDQQELAAANDLGAEIRAALASSQFLIVLCTPAAAKSHWVNAEIDAFKRSRPDGCVLAVIGAGEPFASEVDGRSDEECFPAALRLKYDKQGRPTARKAEPLAADLRYDPEQRRTGFLKLVAGMLGVGLDDLVQRDTIRRQKRLAWVAAASLAGMAMTSLLAVTAIQARDSARDQRREAEGLVAFMLGDLKDKLEPIGKLDALDGVGTKVLDYYSKQDASDLSDAGLLQRSQALSLTAQVAYMRGNLDSARRLYQEALAGTAEAIRRNPDDPQRLYDHAQNIFYFGSIAADRGDLAGAEHAFRDYGRLAKSMTTLQPDNLRWKMEAQYAAANLGFVLLRQRRFEEAVRQFAAALATIEAVAAVDPANADYQRSLAESLAWLADAQVAQGNVTAAIGARQRQVTLLKALAAHSNDVAWQEKLIPAQQSLGSLLAAMGDERKAEEQLQAAVATADKLVPAEPNNSQWINLAGSAHFELAQQAMLAQRLTEAAPHVAKGCEYAERLNRSSGVVLGQSLHRMCLSRQAQLALASGNAVAAASYAERASELGPSVKTGDPVSDRYTYAESLLVAGDAYRVAGDGRRARQAWARGLSLAQSPDEKPGEGAVHAELLDRTGQPAAAARLRKALLAHGIRNARIL